MTTVGPARLPAGRGLYVLALAAFVALGVVGRGALGPSLVAMSSALLVVHVATQVALPAAAR